MRVGVNRYESVKIGAFKKWGQRKSMWINRNENV